MSNVVHCPICKTRRVTKSRNKFFRCCGVLHSVKDNLLGSGIKRYDIRRKIKSIPTKEETIKVKVV